MLNEICGYLKNWFENDQIFDVFTISDNVITKSDGSAVSFSGCNYFRVVGDDPSINDGVYPVSEYTLQDDSFKGAVWKMAVPADVIALAAEIAAWREKYETIDSQAMSPFNSESFGGYSYSKSSGGNGADGVGDVPGWAGVFGGRLSRYRKL